MYIFDLIFLLFRIKTIVKNICHIYSKTKDKTCTEIILLLPSNNKVIILGTRCTYYLPIQYFKGVIIYIMQYENVHVGTGCVRLAVVDSRAS